MASGSNYAFSAYGPQLGSRLHLTHTQISIVGLSGTVGVYGTAPLLGKLVDARGYPIPLTIAFFALLTGYFGIRRFYISGLPEGISSLSFFGFLVLLLCGLLTGIGANAGMASAINATAKSFPDHARTVSTSLVLSGFGLSAFVFSTLAHVAFPGDTSSFLLVLAIGTSLPMILGFFFVKPIPLPPRKNNHPEGFVITRRLSSNQRETPFLSEADARVPLLSGDSYEDADLPTTRAPKPSTLRVGSPDTSPSTPIDVDEEPTHLRSTSLSNELRHNGVGSTSLPDISGMGLVRSVEFWLLFTITTLLSGTALMYINNVGSVSQALYAKSTPTYDDGRRIIIGMILFAIHHCYVRKPAPLGILVDSSKRFWGLRRPMFISLVAILFIISQITAFNTSDVEQLWKASSLLGLSYGSSVGLFPSITIDWFGLAHFSENWGFISLAPVLGGNIFSIAFGRILDAHSPVASALNSQFSGVGNDLGERCLDGRDCYKLSFGLTILACCLALCLGVYAAWRDQRTAKAAGADFVASEDDGREDSAWVE
ncbi:hypothetical protein NLI96_g6485 [Meripilus lineatus]|uniref:MFS general substrate transporter n=1 Tax=Meripilus lineatus TaxID=2056292 RepID=A0AAD5V0Z3_9APHY|nr:hypothetical protein NLI96_g6485 [Physisporinus lineatus]